VTDVAGNAVGGHCIGFTTGCGEQGGAAGDGGKPATVDASADERSDYDPFNDRWTRGTLGQVTLSAGSSPFRCWPA